ncbi:MAG: sulfotransferase [Alphaproteobacteria bacterium]|nr:MAG: sulfotransferase [Alphaproteobacteria bacterium]
MGHGWRAWLIDRLMASWRVNRWVERRIRDELAGLLDAGRRVPLPPRPQIADTVGSTAAPMDDVGRKDLFSQLARARARPALFVTARFRSGSTLLWRMLDELDGLAAYYEPLNPRRWHRLDSSGAVQDPTHAGIDDYRRNYDGLDDLDRFFRDDWSRHRLYMDERAADPDLEHFIAGIIARAPDGARPALQFNRIDFRLAWLRSRFPAARIMHLYRNPRDSFISAIAGARLGTDARFADFAPHDRFYLREWIADLAKIWPPLMVEPQAHPYLPFYMLWRLSHAHGRYWADATIRYEDLCRDPAAALAPALAACGITPTAQALAAITSMSRGLRPPRWPEFAPDDWFTAFESEGERRLAAFFAQAPAGAARGDDGR